MCLAVALAEAGRGRKFIGFFRFSISLQPSVSISPLRMNNPVIVPFNFDWDMFVFYGKRMP